MAKRCNHKMTRYDWGRDATGAEVAISRWCLGCGAQLGLGPSNDEPEAVKVEMRAAKLVGRGFRPMTKHERHGYQTLYYSDDFAPSDYSAPGWLCHEIVNVWMTTIEERPNAWSWDPSRPIAEQLAETARDDAAADAMAKSCTERAVDCPSLGCALAGSCLRPIDECKALGYPVQEDDALEYEVTRAAEPDCRDEDVHTANCDTLTDDAFPCNCDSPTLVSSPDVVCSCAGDALRSERCEDKS